MIWFNFGWPLCSGTAESPTKFESNRANQSEDERDKNVYLKSILKTDFTWVPPGESFHKQSASSITIVITDTKVACQHKLWTSHRIDQ